MARHEPLGPVHGLVDLVQHIPDADGEQALHGFQIGSVFVEDQLGPDLFDLVGVAHLDLDGGELLNGPRLGLRRQEGVLLHAELVGLDDLLHQGHHVRLGRLAEVGPAVVDAHGLGIHLGNGLIGLLLQGRIGGHARQRPPVGPAQGTELLGKVRRAPQQGFHIGPVAVELKVLRGEVAVHLPDGLGIVDHQDLGSIRPIQVRQELLYVEGRHLGGYLLHVHGVVALVVFGPLQLALDLLGHQGVVGQGVVQILLLLLRAEGGEGEGLGGHVRPDGQQLLARGVVRPIVSGVRQDDLRPHHDEGVLRGVRHVGGDLHPDGQIRALYQQLRRLIVELVHGLDPLQLLKQGQGGGDPLPVPPFHVQHLPIEGDGILHLGDVAGLLPRRKGGEVRHHDPLHVLIEIGKAAGGGPVLRDHGGLEPFAVDRFI